MQLSFYANQTLQEFGSGAVPESLLSFEDAQREFLAVRALELQKAGIAASDVTVTKQTVSPSMRDDIVPPGFGNVTPAFAELAPFSDSTGNLRYKVEIVPIEDVPSYEGARVIGFYGNNPLRYRIGWDAWDEGDLYLWYDPIEDISQINAGSDLSFPTAFWMFAVKKTALNLVRVLRLKIALIGPDGFNDRMPQANNALDALEKSLFMQCGEWQLEWKKYLNLDLSTGPHLRRSNSEIRARGYHAISGKDVLRWD